ncbi:E3 ubiquitin--protein ligase [Salmonella enterica subsp. arizonae serovar 18:z4,z23:-]|uniref:RING-type E3 ubiquitin transferase n=3 Tax=Salmonella enterica TaxID=28901 RepID=A0A5W1EXS9_SALER|nr:E3 ubiquitin--protein ligase [Salmonella enterica]EBV8736625.1 E3 ubiquitin--protein ligase [Salmonella enterica subsp. arizonae serovar 18:z4,z23:-]EBV9432544.1 E3 ubiquitin--protein ligase [Salmonella enterica subsp. enterica serovar Heidelberg]ECC3428225.1 E3 ubiquitin--protein ligase [Salmonella enterica subsp. arizonae]ECE0069235.1 E3 ubiquitin--protein ligase [Salmonella enterica subsp. enterica]ECU7350657.1 E3 ubiquitin--protein ligase [Salmonella enterica subsp. enterica serovar Ken
MPFYVGSGCRPATISNRRIYRIAWSDTPPEMSSWEKCKEFFCSTHQTEALECIRTICHPPAGTTREDVVSRFEQLRTLAYAGCEENIHSGLHGENHFCIMDEDNQEILSVTLDDAGNYTVNCQGYSETHHFTMATEPGVERTEHAEGASGTSCLPATTAPQTAAEYDAVWSAWQRAAPKGEARGRAAVVQEMRDCLKNGNPVLNVGGAGLTTLPDHLPPHITKLIIPRNNYLTRLSRLPPGLRELSVDGNLLASLPALPLGLQSLSVPGNQLPSLPDLPSGLRKLWASGNRLTSLSALPSGLRELIISSNRLTSLPALPSELRELSVSHNLLPSLPALPSGLQELSVSHNRLTRLPESIISLPSYARVNLDGNPLSERTLRTLRNLTSAPGYSGPRIRFDMAGPSVPREARALHLAVADWLMPAREGEPDPADRWHASGQEDNAAAFSLFLDRLRETENFEKDAGFKAQISSWLALLAEDDVLRAKTFAMATEATSSCEDRVTFALHQMKNVQLVHNAEKGVYDNNLPGLVSTGREMFRMEMLERIALEKVRTLAFVDEIEVCLAYQNKLKESLELTSVTAEMRFFGASGVTASDLRSAERQVKAAENSEFSEWILQWGPLHSVLERKEPERFNALREKQISDYEDTYQMLSDTELKPSGLVGNTDADRTIGVRAMESAKKEFLNGLRPLVEEMLGSYLKVKARWRLN